MICPLKVVNDSITALLQADDSVFHDAQFLSKLLRQSPIAYSGLTLGCWSFDVQHDLDHPRRQAGRYQSPDVAGMLDLLVRVLAVPVGRTGCLDEPLLLVVAEHSSLDAQFLANLTDFHRLYLFTWIVDLTLTLMSKSTLAFVAVDRSVPKRILCGHLGERHDRLSPRSGALEPDLLNTTSTSTHCRRSALHISKSWEHESSKDSALMTNEIPSARSRHILIIGAGELGMPVLRNVARRARDVNVSTVSVLLRANTVESAAPDKQRDLAEIRNLGVRIVQGDLVKNTVDELASIFANYDTVIGCTGITAGLDTPMKVAQAALQAKLPRYFPWQFGVDFDVIGRGSPQDIFDSQLDVRDLLRSQHETEWGSSPPECS